MKTAYRYYIHHDYEYVYYAVPKVCTRTILKWLLNNKCINFDKLDGHAKLQNSIIPKNISFLGRFENFTKDFNYITNTLFKESFKNTLRLNTTNHKHYSEYYDKSLAQKVYKKYHQDFERFEYTF